jgi:DNA-binding transcriptional MocR family regulator
MKYQAIARDLKQKIDQGLFRPGERLPSVRSLSGRLDVSVSTVVAAYQLLEQERHIEARAKSGFYVGPKSLSKPTLPPKVTSLRPARLSISDHIADIFANTRNDQYTHFDLALPQRECQPQTALKTSSNRVLRQQFPQTLLMSTSPGIPELRRLLAQRLLSGGCLVSPEQIVITNGCQEALMLSLQAVCSPGDLVAVESPCYYGFLLAIESLGLKVVNIATDPQHGLDLNALEDAAKQWPIKACICTANFNNPTGGLMSDESKRELLNLAERNNFVVIEDDILGELHHEGSRPSSLKAFDHQERVIYCSSLSKSLSPGLRLGWVVAGTYQSQIIERQLANSSGTASFPQLLAAEYLKSGHFDKHLARVRPLYQNNLERALNVIQDSFPEGTRATQPAGGFLIWVALPKKINALDLFELARAHNICFLPGVVFGRQHFKQCLRLSFGGLWTDKVESQLRTLGRLAGHLFMNP